ncbi:MAG: metalloregulator ArsR/SmtB family transcription factor, partial [Myxococcota bacterium]
MGAFEAIADPTRRQILDLLSAGEYRAGELARRFPISRPALSRHLRVLRHARLVRETRRGRHRFYALCPDPLREVDT